MEKIHRILVGLDVIEKSDNVLKRALQIAAENQTDLFVVHAIHIPWLAMPNYLNTDEISVDKSSIEKMIENKIVTLNEKTKVPYTIFVKEGRSEDILLYEAQLHKADMMVIGAHSKKKGRKGFLGTTAQKVAHKSHIPVLVVKNSAKKVYENIVAPTDFEAASKESVLFAKQIFPSSKWHLVNVFETIYFEGPYALVGRDLSQFNPVAKNVANNDMKAFMKEVGVKKGKIIDADLDLKATLLEYINKKTFSLTVVGSQGTAGINALLGSVAAYILRESENDVLVYVPKKTRDEVE